MFIVTVKSIDADSFALPTLYGKTTLQNYNFSVNPQVPFFLFLEKKEAKIQGRHQRTQRTKRTLPRHVGRGPRAQPSEALAFPHSVDFTHTSCRHRDLLRGMLWSHSHSII